MSPHEIKIAVVSARFAKVCYGQRRKGSLHYLEKEAEMSGPATGEMLIELSRESYSDGPFGGALLTCNHNGNWVGFGPDAWDQEVDGSYSKVLESSGMDYSSTYGGYLKIFLRAKPVFG